MKLELEEMGNIHTDTIWLEIIDSQSSGRDESNTISKMAGITEIHYRLGRLFTAAPDLLIACRKQQIVIEKLLTIHPPKTIAESRLIKNACSCAKKAIARANGKT